MFKKENKTKSTKNDNANSEVLVINKNKNIDKVINIALCIILFLLPLITIPRGMSSRTYNVPKYIIANICSRNNELY